MYHPWRSLGGDAVDKNPDNTGVLIFFAYCLLGLPVAWMYMKRQKMVEPFRQIEHHEPQNVVIFTLAVLWAILLAWMVLDSRQKRKAARKKAGLQDDAARSRRR
jgi:hypothetical protein